MKELDRLYSLFKESKGVSTDTRTLTDGQIFFALKGENFNGNKHAQDALAKGAILAVIDEPQYAVTDNYLVVSDSLHALQLLARKYRDSLKIPVLGITGTNGKTTSKELLTLVMSQKYKVAATSGNFNNHIGVPLTILHAPSDCEFLIVEMGTNQPGDIKLLCEIADPIYGVITNIGAGHLEKLKSLTGVFNEKRALFDHVRGRQDGLFFINLSDKYLLRLLDDFGDCIGYTDEETPAGMLSWSTSENNCLQLSLADGTLIGIAETNLIGDYNRFNIALAITIGNYFGIAQEHILTAVSQYRPKNMRSEFRQTSRNRIILDAYNANPSSMRSAIESFYASFGDNKCLILGDMLELGRETRKNHQSILAIIDQRQWDDVILVGAQFHNLAEERWQCFPSTEALFNSGILKNWSDRSIMIKGSRGIGLEKIVSQL